MNRTREQLLPILCHWLTFLAHALPRRSVPTFLERVVGALLSRRGWVTAAYLAIAAQRHWTSYYQWLQQGRWSWLRVGQYLAVWLRCSFQRRGWYLVVDDSINCRVSPQAPSRGRHHNHSRKVNRPRFLQGQCWVLLAAGLSQGRRYGSAIPLLARWQRTVGNRSKLRAACVLLRAVGAIFQDCQVRVLLDGRYIRCRVIQYAQAWGFAVVGQVRRDTALYAFPMEVVVAGGQRRRGRPRRYGLKYTPERVATLPERRVRLWLYGKRQWVRYRSAQVKARFLQGQGVRVVWVQFEAEDATLGATRLLLATEADLRPEVIIKAYARRWPIEPLFNQGRHSWGWLDAWQQSRQVLARWVQIGFVADALAQRLVLKGGDHLAALTQLTPWRQDRPVTAGLVRLALQRLLGQVNLRDWWHPKSRKFPPPAVAEEMVSGPPLAQAA
jgi:hypothetical protein